MVTFSLSPLFVVWLIACRRSVASVTLSFRDPLLWMSFLIWIFVVFMLPKKFELQSFKGDEVRLLNTFCIFMTNFNFVKIKRYY